MSHFTRVRTVVRDQVVLEEALRELRYDFQTGERLPIRGYPDNREFGQVVVNTGSRYDIGFQRQPDSSYNVCADWWGVQGNTPIRQESFLSSLHQAYAHRAILNQAEREGLIVEEDRVLETGERRLILCERY